MTEGEDSAVWRAAAAVADGDVVDWQSATQGANADESGALAHLQTIAAVAAAYRAAGETAAHLVAALEDAVDLPDGAPRTWGPLQLRARLGGGSFGEVYRAFDPALQREVALKLMRPASGDAEAMLAEARRLARVRHPHVVTVYGADVHEGRPGIWMEYLRGETLEDAVRRATFSAREAAALGVDLCGALAAVHGAGLLHLDLKTANVMRADGGRIVLMDFGSGHERAAAQRGAQAVTGTPAALAPEVLRGAPPSRAADIYALGVLLYRMVSGAYPVEAANAVELFDKHARGERVPLRDRCPQVPAAFAQAVERALAADPAERYANAGEFEAALAGAPAVPRRRGMPWVAGVCVLLAAAGVWRLRTHDIAPPLPAGHPAIETPIVVPPAAATAPVPVRAEAKAFRVAHGQNWPLAPGASVAPGDGVYLTLRGDDSLYAYVLNEDATGALYVLYPVRGLDTANPLAPGSAHRLPGALRGAPQDWEVTSAGEDESIVVIAARRPLPTLERDVAQLAQAAPGAPVEYARASPSSIATLRGLGGLASHRTLRARADGSRITTLLRGLSAAERDSAGIWLWELRLRNPS